MNDTVSARSRLHPPGERKALYPLLIVWGLAWRIALVLLALGLFVQIGAPR